jgi:regulator of protease activity HflC (stomatin/prohibitin superfamily)
MITLIFLALGILALIGAGAIIVQMVSNVGTGWSVGKVILTVVLIVTGIIVIIVGFGFREVGPGQVGVKTRFGEVQTGTLSPGLHWIVPAVDGLVIYDGRVQAYNFEEIVSATQDLQEVRLSGLINYHIDAEKADLILQEIGGPGNYAQKVFLRPSNTALKEITPDYSASNVVSKRDEIGNRALESLQGRMEDFHIIVDRVSVENVGLNDLFLASVEAKQIAGQDLARADFEAQTKVKQAEGERDARVTRAAGESDANDLISASLSEELLQWTYIQKLSDKVRLMMLPSEQNFMLDLSTVTEEALSE